MSISDINGIYVLSSLAEGNYVLTTTKDGFQVTSTCVSIAAGQTTIVDFSLISIKSSTSDMWIERISITMSGNSLCTEIGVAGDNGPVSGADAELTLTLDNGNCWSFAGVTDYDGRVVFRLAKASTGNYTATINNLNCDGYTWDRTQGIISASYSLLKEPRGKPRQKDK